MTMVLIFLLDTHSPDKVSYFFELFEGNTFTASENWRSFALSVRTKPLCVVSLVRFTITTNWYHPFLSLLNIDVSGKVRPRLITTQ